MVAPTPPASNALSAAFSDDREGIWFTHRKWRCTCEKWFGLAYDPIRKHLHRSCCSLGERCAKLDGLTDLCTTLQARARSMPLSSFLPDDPESWVTAPGQHCTGCDKTFLHNAADAPKNQCDACPTTVTLRDVELVELPCGDYRPRPHYHPRTVLPSPSSFRPEEECLPQAAIVDQATIKSRIEGLVHESDDPCVWAKIFRIGVHHETNEDLLSKVLATKAATKTPGPELAELFRCAEYLYDHLPASVHLVGGGVRAALQIYKWEGHGQSDDGDVQAFTERQTSTSAKQCIKQLMAYVHLYHPDRLRGALDWMQRPDYTVEEAHRRGLAASLLYDLVMEDAPTGMATILVEFSLVHLGRASGEHDLSLVECGTAGRLLSCLQYALRAGVLQKIVLRTSLPGASPSAGTDIAKASQETIIMNHLGPAIAKLRGMKNTKPAARRINVDADGNITIDLITLSRTASSNFIPAMLDTFAAVCEKVFDGDDWKQVTDPSNRIVYTNWPKAEGHVLLRCGGKQHLEALRLSDKAKELADHFTVLGMLAFLTLGCGAGRFTEVDRLETYQVVWRNGDLFFTLVTRKKGALCVRAGKPRLLLLPRDIARHIVLLRAACKLLGRQTSGRRLFPDSPDLSHAFSQAFKELMHLDTSATIGKLFVRHWTTTNLNMLFPSGMETFGTVVSGREVSEKSGHTERTANSHYSCVLDQRLHLLAHEYHKSLGYNPQPSDPNPPPGRGAHDAPDEGAPLTVLRAMFGSDATFQTPQQEQAFEILLQHRDAHAAVLLGPGGGKTAAALAPLVFDYVSGEDPSTLIFVVPHAPLVGHQVASIQNLLRGVQPLPDDEDGNAQDHFWVVGYTGSDIAKGRIPDEWKYHEDMPHVAVLTVDALAHLIKYHAPVVDAMRAGGGLGSVVIDEVQTLGGELEFRTEVYELMRRVSSWGSQVILLSGSITPAIAADLGAWLRLKPPVPVDGGDGDDTSFRIVQGGDPIGAMFNFEVAEVLCPDFLNGCARMVERRATAGTSVHVVCALKSQAKTLAGELGRLFRGRHPAKVIATTTGDDPSGEKTRLGAAWVSGKVDIWVTTSAGLEGNENKRCHQVYLVGLPGSMSNWLQIAGRIRRAQGGPHSFVTQLMPQGAGDLSTHASFRSKSDDGLMGLLYKEQKILAATPHQEARNILAGGAVVQFYRTDECLLTTARALFQHEHGGGDCRRCTNCDRKHGERNARCAEHGYGPEQWCKPFVAGPPAFDAASASTPPARTPSVGMQQQNPNMTLTSPPHILRGAGPESGGTWWNAEHEGARVGMPAGSACSGDSHEGSLSGRKRSSTIQLSGEQGSLSDASTGFTGASVSAGSQDCQEDGKVSDSRSGWGGASPLLGVGDGSVSVTAMTLPRSLVSPEPTQKKARQMPQGSRSTPAFAPADILSVAQPAGAGNRSWVAASQPLALRRTLQASQAATGMESDQERQAKTLYLSLVWKCPWCHGPDCIGSCTVVGQCNLCGAAGVFHSARDCPMTLQYRCNCGAFSTSSLGDYHKLHKRGNQCTAGYSIVDNLGKQVQNILKTARVCYGCYNWECSDKPCRSRSQKTGTRVFALLRKCAADSNLTLVALMSQVYSSPTVRNRFFATMPKATPQSTKLSTVLRWNPDDQRFGP